MQPPEKDPAAELARAQAGQQGRSQRQRLQNDARQEAVKRLIAAHEKEFRRYETEEREKRGVGTDLRTGQGRSEMDHIEQARQLHQNSRYPYRGQERNR